MKLFLSISCLVSLILMMGCSKQNLTFQPGQHPQSFKTTVCQEVKLDYQLYLPKEYGKTDKKWPLVLFLHGAGERGSEVDKVKIHGLPKLAQDKDFEFIVVSPQCPKESWWPNQSTALMALLEFMEKNYQVDSHRLYITGLSMGGFGAWSMITKYPDKFAAAAPICGGGDAVAARLALKKMPVWAFHGAKDEVVPLKQTEDMVNALKQAGNTEVKLTVYPEANHDSWTETYNNPELYAWLLQHSR